MRRALNGLTSILGLFVLACVALMASPASAADVDAPSESYAATAPAPSSGIQWHNPFGPCEMNCAATVYLGRYIETPMTDIFLKLKEPPWDWRTKDSTLVSGSFSREILTGNYWAFETEIGAGKRFGVQDEWELWGALYARWKVFPWHDYLRTTVAVSTGLNYASGISELERTRSKSGHSQVLHYLSPEITFGLPSQPNLDVVFRFHHRSGGNLGVFNGTGGGSQYQTVGIRYRW